MEDIYEEKEKPGLTEHRQLDALNEDPGFHVPPSVHHHEALVSPRVSDLNVADDQRTIPGAQLLLRNLHAALKLLGLPLLLSALLEHCVVRRGPLDVAGGGRRLRAQALLPAAGKDRLVPHQGGDRQGVGDGGEGRGVWKKRRRRWRRVSSSTKGTWGIFSFSGADERLSGAHEKPNQTVKTHLKNISKWIHGDFG